MSVCKKHIIGLILSLVSCTLFGQQDLRLSPIQLKENGELSLQRGDYFSAVDFLFQYHSINPSDIDACYKLAEAYRKSNDYEQAKQFYSKSYQVEPKKYDNALFYFALMLKYMGAYFAAADHFNRYITEHIDQAKQPLYQRAQLELKGCRMALDINFEEAENRAIISSLNTSINKPFIELSPVYIDSVTMMYSSYPFDSVKYYKNNLDSIPKRRFFKAQKYANNWEGYESKDVFNDPNFHVGNGVFSKDKMRFYFTKCSLEESGNYACRIFFSKQNSGIWSIPIELPENINYPEYTTTQPSIQSLSETKDLLYFVSNRNDGFGGQDIWFSEYDFINLKASEAINLGPNINTPLDEITPHYQEASKTLYFSSNGQVSLGGFDIFKTSGERASWSPIENIGPPFNTNFDDLYFVPRTSTAEDGFLVSNRDGTNPLRNKNCCDDVFAFKVQEEIKIIYEGKLYNASYVERILEMEDDEAKNNLIADESKYIIPHQKIVMYTFSANGSLIPIDSTTTDHKGLFNFKISRNKKYKFIVERDGFFNKHHTFNTRDIVGTVMREHIGMIEMTLEPIIIKNIYYPFDEWYLTQEAKTIIDTTVYEVLFENPKLIIELSSHTDHFGTDNYNENLSQKRAESVVKYLIYKKIDPKRLRAKGYGEHRPIAPNTYTDGSDNPDGRQRNRRTEFRIIGKLVNDKVVIYEE